MSELTRVLQVVTHMNRGGLETMLMNYYRHIDRKKIQFDFLVHRQERGAYDDEIEALGGMIYRLPRLVPWSRVYLSALDSFFARHPEYEIVHVHQDCLSSVILKAAQKHGVPVRIAHSHNSQQDKNLKYLIKLWYRRFIPRYATQLLSCGTKAGQWMFGGAPFQILNNAIDASAYSYNEEIRRSVRTSLSLTQDTFVIGHVGRFSPQKNHEFLIDIFSALHTLKPNSVLLLVGGGELQAKIQDKVNTLGLSDCVIFAGVRSDVANLMQAMDVFVFPSLYEGLPLTIVEAQAAGLPCYISDHVPEECIMTNLVKHISLTDSAVQWSNTILQYNRTRVNMHDKLCAAGFDIKSNVRWLESYYLNR